VSALLLRAITNGGGQTNECRLVLLATSLGDRVVDSFQVTELRLGREQLEKVHVTQLIPISDMQDLPTIRKVPLFDILGEGDSRVAVDGNI